MNQTNVMLPVPIVKLRQLTLNHILSLRAPNYRQILDLTLNYIEDNNLQDPFQRNKIRLDPVFKLVFKNQLESLIGDRQIILVQELPTLVKNFCK